MKFGSGGTYFLHADAIGSTGILTTQTNAVWQNNLYYPFGAPWEFLHCQCDIRFAKLQERDAATGFDPTHARDYASNLGRWMSPDPLGGHLEDPQTLNKYSYVRNNPLSLTDPTGLDSYLTCTHTDQNASICQQETVGYDKNGNAQTAWVQGVTGQNGFTATLIGNQNADGTGPLVDKTTGTGTYTASVNGSGVQFSNDGGQTSSTGVFVNGTPQTTFQDAGFANGGALSGFNFTLTNSKLRRTS